MKIMSMIMVLLLCAGGSTAYSCDDDAIMALNIENGTDDTNDRYVKDTDSVQNPNDLVDRETQPLTLQALSQDPKENEVVVIKTQPPEEQQEEKGVFSSIWSWISGIFS